MTIIYKYATSSLPIQNQYGQQSCSFLLSNKEQWGKEDDIFIFQTLRSWLQNFMPHFSIAY